MGLSAPLVWVLLVEELDEVVMLDGGGGAGCGGGSLSDAISPSSAGCRSGALGCWWVGFVDASPSGGCLGAAMALRV